MSELVAAFAAARQAVGKPAVELADLAARLASLCERAHAALVTVVVDRIALAGALGEHAPADGASHYLDHCRIEELALTVAARSGDSQAIRAIERRCEGVLGAVAARYGHGEHTADDIRQQISTKLFVAEPGERPTVARYSGGGSLPHWVRVIAVRLCIDLGRRKDRQRELAIEDVSSAIALDDLYGDRVRHQYRDAVREGLRAAVLGLTPSERQLLRQHFVHRLSIDQLGAALGIHRATAARRLASARQAVAAAARDHVQARLHLSGRELDDVFGWIASTLDLSLDRLFASLAKP